MPSIRSILAIAAGLSTASAAFQGFNYGATFTNGAIKKQADFEKEFTTAAELEGTNGTFTSARLYTMIQGETPNDPISAIPAAIKTKTSLLFGLWASAGDTAFKGEIEALKKTIDQYCDKLDGLVAGISVGSEDLYRITSTGQSNGENPGAGPDTLVGYIKQVRDTIKGTCLKDAPIGHVDTWTAYDNSSNNALIEAVDWLGVDAYAYFETTKPNGIENGAKRFQEAVDRVKAVSKGRDIYVTETGWPVSGKKSGDAVPSPENARTFWEDVGCPMFGKTNVWWFTLQDAAPDTPNPSFGLISGDSTKPLFDLKCDAKNNDKTSSSSSSGSGTGTATKSATGTGSEVSATATATGTTGSQEPSPTQSGSGNGGKGDTGNAASGLSSFGAAVAAIALAAGML